jgi:branched-chain amino acid transport system permease protein
MNIFLQQLATGLSIGSVYALLAVGYALIYSIFDFTNFAFGALMMIGTYAAFYSISLVNIPLLGAIIIAMLITAIASILVELLAYRPMRAKKASRLYLMITAMGVNIFIQNLAIQTIGGSVKAFPSDWAKQVVDFGIVKMPRSDILAAVISLTMLVILWHFLYKSRLGLGIRASAYDTRTAGLMGLNVNLISLTVFAISGFTAGLSGVFFGMKYAVYPAMGGISNKAFIAAVIGGLGSLPGAVIGGIVLGLIETMVSAYISTTFRDLFSYATLVLILLFLPNGLLGKSVQDKL